MNVSATRLVYVSKKGAKVKNEDTGDFLNEVPNGIPVEAGDLISVEGIAVESRGVGSSIIEIPSRVLDYPYLTNKMIMRMWYYIHHNYQYTCILPFTQNTFTSVSGLGYGYATQTNITIGNVGDFSPKNVFQERVFAGGRFYVGAFTDAGTPEQLITPVSKTTAQEADEYTNPSVSDFNFIECNREISVDVGYDSPANIGEQITSDFHEGRFAPNIYIQKDGEGGSIGTLTQYAQPNEPIGSAGQVGQPVLGATGSQDECVITIRSIPWAMEQNAPSPLYYGLYQGLMAVANPLYYYYGTRLLNENANNKINRTPFLNVGNDGDIYVMNDITNNGADTTPQEGELLITSLRYNLQNLLWLRGLIHSQKNLSQLNKLTTAELRTPENKKLYNWNIPMGRYDDSTATPYASKSTLNQPYLPAQSIAPTYADTYAFYNQEFYESAGYFDTTGLGATYTLDPDILINGLNPKEISKAYDINVFCVRTPAGLTPPITYDYAIAIPLKQAQSQLTNHLIKAGNYCVCDLTFSRPEATACLITCPQHIVGHASSPPSYDDIMRCMSIGSPDMSLEFDDQRGRFAFKNMYWANRIGNTDEAGSSNNPLNPDAEQEVINSNAIADGEYRPAGTEIIYTKYAQSGLGLVDLSVLDEDGTEFIIDQYKPDEVKERYTGSLLDRLGFDYYSLINRYGRPMVMFQEQFYDTLNRTQYASFFPFPLTNNPLIDTTFNQYINTNDNFAPLFNLSTQRDATGVNVACQTSFIYASNLPQKLASPYWIIASDIIDGVKFVKDGKPVNCLAVCNRSYISGDFAFSFSTDYKFKADIPFTISSIKTNVYTQDLLPADIDDGTSIIYKIEKQYQTEIAQQEESQKGGQPIGSK
jgi:hypothetical protein